MTITGPGGIGKTRLALELAAQCRPAFADGIYFIPLAPVQSARFIVPVIADSLSFGFQAEALLDPQTQLFNFLYERQSLLLIDNLEHLLSDNGLDRVHFQEQQHYRADEERSQCCQHRQERIEKSA